MLVSRKLSAPCSISWALRSIASMAGIARRWGLERPEYSLTARPTGSPATSTPNPTASLNVDRSEEHTSELQSLMRKAYAVFCLQKKIVVDPTPVDGYENGISHI